MTTRADGRAPSRILASMVSLSLAAVACCQESLAEKSQPQGGVMPDPTTYPTSHASPRRDCALAVSSNAKGTIAWSKAIEPRSAVGVADLLVWSGRVVVDTDAAVALYDVRGERTWTRAKHSRSPVAVANDALYLENADLYLEAVNAKNEMVLKKAYLPGVMADDFRLTLLAPGRTDFVATVAFAGQQEEPGAKTEPPGPRLAVRRTVYGERIGAWTGDFEGRQTLPSLFVPGTSRVVFGVEASVVGVSVETGDESRFPVPLGRIVEWSADDAGNLAITGYDGDAKVLVALTPAGGKVWRWKDSLTADPWAAGQPPVRAKGGRVYALTDTRVLAIDAGTLAWAYDAAREQAGPGAAASTKFRRATSLGDGSILVAGGRTLRHIDAAGKLLFAVDVDADIVSSPVADSDGNVYVATATHLVQIR